MKNLKIICRLTRMLKATVILFAGALKMTSKEEIFFLIEIVSGSQPKYPFLFFA
jgi:hypothetical protein